jgi:ribosomal-protein-serine acetyltransferase
MLEIKSLRGERVVLRPSSDEGSYLRDMKLSHRWLEPAIYGAAQEFRFHPDKVLLDIRANTDGSRLGGISIHGFSKDPNACEFGYWILPRYLGQGYVREASLLLLDLLFHHLHMARVSLIVDIRNKRSIAVAEHLGFAAQGILKGKDHLTEEPIIKLVYARYDAQGLEAL